MRLFAANPEKRFTEQLFLGWGVGWILIFGGVVATGVYQQWGDLGYMLIGLVVSVPYVVLPALLVPKTYRQVTSVSATDIGAASKRQQQQDTAAVRTLVVAPAYWVKANIWIGIFGFVGNYVWTHYFYHVLGASYSFPVTIELNRVPVSLYLITHAYFCFYHTLTNLAIRAVRTSLSFQQRGPLARTVVYAALVVALGVFTAFMETWTIASVPYYQHHDKFSMYTIGSVFYGIYFFVSFPMFFRLDESVARGSAWSIKKTCVDALAATMIVTLLLDFARLAICAYLPSMIPPGSTACATLPFLQLN